MSSRQSKSRILDTLSRSTVRAQNDEAPWGFPSMCNLRFLFLLKVAHRENIRALWSVQLYQNEINPLFN